MADAGLRMVVEGEKEFKAAIADINAQMKLLGSEMKLATSEFDKNEKSVESLTARNNVLTKEIDAQKSKVETLKAALKSSADTYGENDEKTQKWAIQLNNAQAELNGMERELAANTKELEELAEEAKKSNEALRELGETGDKLKKLGDSISDVGKKFLPVTNTVKKLGTTAVKTASDFDTSMSKVAAVSGAAGDEFDALREKAREMGAKTKFSASEAADAMNYMAMAGWKTEDMLSGIEGIMNLAAASGEDLATTSDIVTDALTAFGMTAADSGHFADVLAAASSNANTNVSMMGETFKYVAPVAGAMGISAEETAEAIGLLANAGIKGSQAGTVLRSILSRLATNAGESSTKLGALSVLTKELGVQFYETDGSMRNLNDILREARVAWAELSEEQAANFGKQIAGQEGLSGWLALMNAAEADIEKLNTAISECGGSAETMADTMQDNLGGQLTILKSQLDELAISFGDMLMPILRDVVSHIQGFVDKLNSMDEGTRKVILAIAGVVAAVGPVLIVIGKVVSAVGTVFTAVSKIGPALGAVKTAFAGLNAVMAANPVGIVVVALAGLAAEFIALWNNCEEFREFWINLWETIKSAAVTAWNATGEFLSGAWQKISDTAESVMDSIKTAIVGTWEKVKSGVTDKVTEIYTSIRDGFNNAVDFVKALPSEAYNWGADIIDNIVSGIKGKVESVKKAVSNVASTIREFLHFSVPDTGPLADFEEWMPDFMAGLAQGIEKSRDLVRNAVEHVANDMTINPKIGKIDYSAAIPTDFGVHGDFTASGAAMGGNIYNITIDAANVREFNNIIRIAQGARQSRRLGYVGG